MSYSKNISFRLFIITMTTLFLFGCSNLPTPKPKVTPPEISAKTTEIEWKEIVPGLSYAEINEQQNNKFLQLAKIDPTKFNFEIYENKTRETAKTIKEIHTEQNSLLTFNGQFFTENFKPTGLLISNSEEKNKYSHADLLNGIFEVNNSGKAQLQKSSQDPLNQTINFAIQSGPILIDKTGQPQIEKDTGLSAGRTAIGLDKNGAIIVIFLKQSIFNFDNEISLYYFSHLLVNDPLLHSLGLNSVLNLDGGTSTGLMIDKNYYPEMEKVQNIIMVKSKE